MHLSKNKSLLGQNLTKEDKTQYSNVQIILLLIYNIKKVKAIHQSYRPKSIVLCNDSDENEQIVFSTFKTPCLTN